MSKRSLSPRPGDGDLPPTKKRHTKHGAKPLAQRSFDTIIYDELALHIFSYLTAQELCKVQSCNHQWARLSLDEQLWKGLYLGDFGRARLRGSRGFNPATSSLKQTQKHPERATKSLPGRLKHQNTRFDWKWMYRISSNWRKGRCRTERIDWPAHGPSPTLNRTGVHPVQFLIAGDWVISSVLGQSDTPKITIHTSSGRTKSVLLSKHPSLQPTGVTCMVQDQSAPSGSGNPVKIAAFYATGAFSVFHLQQDSTNHVAEELIYVPSIPSERTSPITFAAYHHPLLVTLSSSFHMSLYQVSDGIISHRQTLSSFTSYPPYSLVLTRPSERAYKLLVAYTVPIYPAHWGVATTELAISDPVIAVTSSRTCRALEIPFGFLNEEKMAAVREQWSRKVAEAVATETDGKWVVLAGTDNVIQVYRLFGRPASGRLTFVRTLHGHTNGIHSLALSDGRCVSIGNDGSIWVWDLECDWGVEVRGRSTDLSRAGRVVFDEKRILCADQNGLEISHFDI